MSTNANRKRGKQNEREIAKRLQGQRVGIFGGEDISHPLFSIECKSRKRFVAEAWMQQAERNTPSEKTPLLIVHITNARRSRDMVMMRMSDFEDFLGRIMKRGGEK